MSWQDKFPKENRYLQTLNGILYHGDCLRILAEFPEESVDLILTDPPYGTNYGKVEGDESLETYLKFLKISFRILKPDRFLITYCFPKFISEVIKTAEEAGFEYEWIGFNYYPNMFKQKPQPLGYNRHEPFLIFSKGHPTRNSFMKDVIHIIMEKERRALHPHEKPLKALDKLVESASKEGQIVLDPFAGSGTTLMSCERLNRKWIGIEIEEEYCRLAKDRIFSCLKQRSLEEFLRCGR